MKTKTLLPALLLTAAALMLLPGADASHRACHDGIDNDGDGRTDYPTDPGCSSTNDNNEYNPWPACNDGIDNDGDGFIDYPNDPGCSSANDTSERGTAVCDDGLDNDADGDSDYPADPGCYGPTDNTEQDPLPQWCGVELVNRGGPFVPFFWPRFPCGPVPQVEGWVEDQGIGPVPDCTTLPQGCPPVQEIVNPTFDPYACPYADPDPVVWTLGQACYLGVGARLEVARDWAGV